jgi:hypothetical protein
MGELAFKDCTFNSSVTAQNKNGSQIQFVNCTFTQPITYADATAESLCEIVDEVDTEATYIEVNSDLTYLRYGEMAKCTKLALPFYCDETVWKASNDLVTIDKEGGVIAGYVPGEVKIMNLTESGFYGDKTLYIVDVDYTTGQLYENGGGYSYYAYGCADNTYKAVNGGKTINLNSPNVNVKRVSIVEYDSDKNYLNWQTSTENPKAFTLNENTAFIRASFIYTLTSEKRKTQLVYEYTITEI